MSAAVEEVRLSLPHIELASELVSFTAASLP